MKDAHLIERLGGPAKVAELLGLDKDGGTQRVHNWKARGIPSRVRLDHAEVFRRAEAEMAADSTPQAGRPPILGAARAVWPLATDRRTEPRGDESEKGVAHG